MKTKDEIRAKLIEYGAKLEKKEDRSGQTRSGWWLDDSYLGKTEKQAWEALDVCE